MLARKKLQLGNKIKKYMQRLCCYMIFQSVKIAPRSSNGKETDKLLYYWLGHFASQKISDIYYQYSNQMLKIIFWRWGRNKGQRQQNSEEPKYFRFKSSHARIVGLICNSILQYIKLMLNFTLLLWNAFSSIQNWSFNTGTRVKFPSSTFKQQDH